jgi:hypothetical protein
MTLNMQTADDHSLMGQGFLTGTPGALRLAPAVSPLALCDRLLTLAEDVDRAGFRTVAEHLLELADEVLEPVLHARTGRAPRHA